MMDEAKQDAVPTHLSGDASIAAVRSPEREVASHRQGHTIVCVSVSVCERED